MKYWSRKILFIIIVSLSILPGQKDAYGQAKNVEEIRKERKKILQDISYGNKRLSEAGKKRNVTMGQIRLINAKINEREKLIDTYHNEIEIIDSSIEKNKNEIEAIKTKIEGLRRSYANALSNYYKIAKQKRGIIELIFSARSLDQAYKRIRYIREFMQYEKKTYEELKENLATLEKKNNELNALITDRKVLISEIDKEKVTYVNERKRKERAINVIRKEERKIRNDIRSKNLIAEKLNKEIEKILEEERNKNKNAAALTPRERVVSDKFEENKGSLPWPIDKGIIIDDFGEKPHPVLTKVKIKNEGIDIMTEKGGKARAVFEGKVSRVVAIPGANEVVIVRHGEYITVYQNLINVRVRNGQEVNTKQILGEVYTDNEKNETILHFEVWKGRFVQNPELWIAK